MKEIELFVHQAEVLKDQHQYRVLVAGRRVGKSYLAVVQAISFAMNNAESVVVIVGSTRHSIMNSAWLTLVNLVSKKSTSVDKRQSQVELLNGSIIQLLGSEQTDIMYGVSSDVDYLIVDELEYGINALSYYKNFIMPFMFERKVKMLFAGTPRTETGLLYQLYMKGQDPNEKDWKSWRISTEDARPDMRQFLENQQHILDFRTYAMEFQPTFADAWERREKDNDK